MIIILRLGSVAVNYFIEYNCWHISGLGMDSHFLKRFDSQGVEFDSILSDSRSQILILNSICDFSYGHIKAPIHYFNIPHSPYLLLFRRVALVAPPLKRQRSQTHRSRDVSLTPSLPHLTWRRALPLPHKHWHYIGLALWKSLQSTQQENPLFYLMQLKSLERSRSVVIILYVMIGLSVYTLHSCKA